MAFNQNKTDREAIRAKMTQALRDNDAEAAYAWALENAAAHDIAEDDLIAFQVEQIRRFKPLIAVCPPKRARGSSQFITTTFSSYK